MAKFVVFLAVGVCLLLLACNEGNIVEGVVDHKAVTGVKDDMSYTILLNGPGDGGPWISVKDKDYEDYFSTDDENAIISEELDRLMKEAYSEVNYFVNVRVSLEEQGTQPYRVSRQIFNEIRIASRIKFRASGTDLPRVIEVLEQTDTAQTGVLEGNVSIGPIWPVEPPGGSPPIPPEVYEARKIVLYDEDGTEVVDEVDITPGENYGHYRVELEPGTYIVDINHLGIDSSSDVPRKIEIRPGHTVEVNIDIDTGIR